MKQHPRVPIVNKARLEISEAISVISQEHELTFGELVGILAERLAFEARGMKRVERHPDDLDKPGDVE